MSGSAEHAQKLMEKLKVLDTSLEPKAALDAVATIWREVVLEGEAEVGDLQLEATLLDRHTNLENRFVELA
jgi:hypothetical protein